MSPSHATPSTPSYDRSPTGSPTDDLARRAITAARAQAMRLASHPRRVDSAWRERAARATRTLAATLGLDPAAIVAVPDDQRLYGLLGIPEVRLIITVPARVPTALPALPGMGTGYPDRLQDRLQDSVDSSLTTGLGQYLFIPETGRTDAFLQLLPCPRCAQLVPTRRILTLVDLGRSLDPEAAHDGKADTEQFPEDPAHESTCPLHLRRR